MAVTTGVRRLWSRPARALRQAVDQLALDDRVRLVVLAGPLVVVDLLLDLVRALAQRSTTARWQGVASLPANLLVHLGVAGLWVALFAVTPRGWPRRLRVVAFHLAVTAYLLLTVATDLFRRVTGSLLDAATLAAATSSPAVVVDIVARTANPPQVAALALVVAYGALAPALVHRLLRRRGPRGSRPDAVVRTGARRVRLATAGGAALTLAAGLAAPLLTGAGPSARHNGVELALGTWDLVQDGRRTTAAAAARPGPTRAPSSLVRTSPGPDDGPSNLVVVVLESLRWSATSLADPDLGTTPFLAELAGSSTVARNAYSAVPHTSKALTSIHCGITPPLDTRLAESEPDRIPATCLPELLGGQGYATAFFQSATGGFERRPDLARNLGFGEFRGVEDLPTEGFGPANYFGYEDDVLLEPSRSWMAAQEQPFALTLLTVAGHHDYTLPDTFEQQHFSDDEELNRYLNTAAYADRFVEKVFDVLDDLGLADDTVVALVGDHGEGFGEHGLRQHDNTIYDEGVHVPLLVHDPSDPRARTVDTPVTTASTMPTALDALGFRVEGAAPVLTPLREAEPAPVHLSCQSANRCLSRIEGSTKFIHHFGHRPDEVFDLAADPLEQDDLAHTWSRHDLQAVRTELLDWRTEVRVAWAPSTGG